MPARCAGGACDLAQMLRSKCDREKCPGNALEKGGKGSITEQCLTPVPMLRLAAVQKPLLKRNRR